jgi:biopolymer transport protein ExbD
MAFGNRNNDQPMSEINVTPLVDVMLVLLVVFIVTAPLLTQSVGVNLPKTVAAAPPPPNAVNLVSVDVEGAIYLNKQKLSASELGERLAVLQQSSPEATVQFEIDDRVNYGKAAEVMAIAQHAGITKIALQTRP